MSSEVTLYLKHKNGALHSFEGKRLKELRREIEAGRGGAEVTKLVVADYIGFLGDDGEIWDLSSLKDHFERR